MRSLGLCLGLFIFLNGTIIGAEISEKTSTSVASKCDYFSKQLGLWHRLRRSKHYDVARTEAVVQAVAGVTARSSLSVPEAMAEVQRWIDRYESYDTDLAILDGALARFYGSSSPNATEGAKKGRLRILQEALESETTQYPFTPAFPRSANLNDGVVSLQRESRLLVQWTIRDRADLESFLKKDIKEAGEFEKLKVKREIEQAELFSKLRRFRAAFPDGSYRQLVADSKNAPPASVMLVDSHAPEAVEASPAAQEVAKEDPAYVTVRLFQQAARIVGSKEDRYTSVLRPSQRALDLVDRVTRTDLVNNYVTARSKLEGLKWVVMVVPNGLGWVQTQLKPFQTPIVFWGSITVLVSTWGGWLLWTKDNVYDPARDWVIYDRESLRAKAYFDMLSTARETISVPARTIEDFYLGLDKRSGFLRYCQDNFSDEAIKIAFEYLKHIRPTPEATVERDPKIDPKRLEGYTGEAKEIIKRRDALLFGFSSPFGSIRGVAERLQGRQYNYWLVGEIIDIERALIQNGKDGLKSSDGTNAPVKIEVEPQDPASIVGPLLPKEEKPDPELK